MWVIVGLVTERTCMVVSLAFHRPSAPMYIGVLCGDKRKIE